MLSPSQQPINSRIEHILNFLNKRVVVFVKGFGEFGVFGGRCWGAVPGDIDVEVVESLVVEGFVEGLDDETLVQDIVLVVRGRSVLILRDLLEDCFNNLL